jgi:hypothetical protein
MIEKLIKQARRFQGMSPHVQMMKAGCAKSVRRPAKEKGIEGPNSSTRRSTARRGNRRGFASTPPGDARPAFAS